MSASELLDEAKDFAELVRGSFTDSGEDWMPTAVGKDTDDKVVFMAIDGSFFESLDLKNKLASMMMLKVVEQKLVSFSFTVGAWFAEGEDSRSPAERPDKKEVLVITAMTATEVLTAMADVHRFEDKPPELGEWEVEDKPYTGRFVEPIQRALQFVEGVR